MVMLTVIAKHEIGDVNGCIYQVDNGNSNESIVFLELESMCVPLTQQISCRHITISNLTAILHIWAVLI